MRLFIYIGEVHLYRVKMDDHKPEVTMSLLGFSQYIGISYPTAMKWRDKGLIPYIKLGGRYMIRLKDANHILREGTESPKDIPL